MEPTNSILGSSILEGAPVAGDGGDEGDYNEGSGDEDPRRLRV